eukprot:353822-Chlamydomonas_euryale.AAC.4
MLQPEQGSASYAVTAAASAGGGDALSNEAARSRRAVQTTHASPQLAASQQTSASFRSQAVKAVSLRGAHLPAATLLRETGDGSLLRSLGHKAPPARLALRVIPLFISGRRARSGRNARRRRGRPVGERVGDAAAASTASQSSPWRAAA